MKCKKNDIKNVRKNVKYLKTKMVNYYSNKNNG